VKGPDSWEGRPRDVPTVRVSQLQPRLHALFKRHVGRRRWTTEIEIDRLLALERFKFEKDRP
jgi:hypothetical protein